ncbi:MAG: hypothetical protein KC994_17625 [Candidatus Omnitrophica bacterium]|nr:hypothetical protein [Candidatus Omnitrophota bacterium]
MPGSATEEKLPLDEVMLAMDVVDTLRHREMLVARELNEEERDKQLIERLREIYAAQGIEVPDRVLMEGVEALKQERFTYTPPPPSFGVKLARIYINRDVWGRLIGWTFGLVVFLWLTYAVLVAGPRNRELASLPRDLQTQHEAILEEAKADEAKSRADSLFAKGTAALEEGDRGAARETIESLRDLREQVEREYEVRIISREGERTGVWRVPDVNRDAKNYYIIVEAVTRDGDVLSLPILNEENGKTYNVKKWGLRVEKQFYDKVAADKQEDGIVNDRHAGEKQRGWLQPEYDIPTTGAAITSW